MAVDKDEVSFRDFLKGKSPEALPFKDFKAEKWAVEGVLLAKEIKLAKRQLAELTNNPTKEAIADTAWAAMFKQSQCFASKQEAVRFIEDTLTKREEYHDGREEKMQGRTFSVGDFINHPVYGEGKISTILPGGNATTAMVAFGNKIKLIDLTEIV